MGFKEAKRRLLTALKTGVFQHAARSGRIEDKNLLLMGQVTPQDVIGIVEKCNGTHHTASPLHSDPSIVVHVLKRSGWYIKFYVLEPDVWFISVHR